MKVVFVWSRWSGSYSIFGHFARRGSVWPPLNIALLAAMCEQRGHESSILDGEVLCIDSKELARRIVASKPDIAAFSMYSPFAHLAEAVSAEVKRLNPEITVVAGGPHATILREEAMKPSFDYLFTGEAERSFPDFLDALQSGEDITKVGGIIYRQDGRLASTGEAQWLTETSMRGRDLGGYYPLDVLPFPARHLLPMDKYFLGTMKGRQHFTSISTFRGCPWRCIFCCSDKLKTTRIVMKSPQRVVEEMCDVKRRWPVISHLYITDDVMTLYPKHITEIVERMDAEGLDFTFEGSTRANLVTDELIGRLAKSGLIRLSFGLETIDPEMRETMGKKIPVEYYPKANRICREHGVEPMNSLMIGLPGETRATVEHTINWVANQRDISQANTAIAVPYVGTEFHDMAVAGDHGLELLDKDFSRYLRYGRGVTNVGDLSAQDLIDLQNEAFVRIYMKPWRWLPVLHKYGLIGFLLQLWRLVKLLQRRAVKSWLPLSPVMEHPKQT